MPSVMSAKCLRNPWWWPVFFLIAGITTFTVWTSANDARHKAWERIIVLPLWPAYYDMRAMTTGWDEVNAGRNPLRVGPGAPTYNYPRVWLLGSSARLTSADTRWIGNVVVILFGLAVMLVTAQSASWEVLLYPAMLLSPPLMLGLERGNTDLIIFCVLTTGMFISGPGRGRLAISAGAFLLAAILKYYPIVAIAALRPAANRPRWVVLGGAGLIFALYLLLTWTDVRTVLQKTDYGTRESYGARIASTKLFDLWVSRGGKPNTLPAWAGSPEIRWRVVQGIGAGLLMTAGLIAWWPAARKISPRGAPITELSARMLIAGAAIYSATFLFSQSWAYRLVFLLWTLPALGQLLRQTRLVPRAWAASAVLLMLFVAWKLADRSDYDAPWGHAASLLLLFPLGACAAAAIDPGPRAGVALSASS